MLRVQTLYSLEVWANFSTVYNQPKKTRSRNKSFIGPVDEIFLADCGEINLKGRPSGNNENDPFTTVYGSYSCHLLPLSSEPVQ